MFQPLPLSRAVGENQINHAADLAATRHALAARGLCACGLPGLAGVHLKAGLLAAIRAFQRGAGFAPDGIITPAPARQHARWHVLLNDIDARRDRRLPNHAPHVSALRGSSTG